MVNGNSLYLPMMTNGKVLCISSAVSIAEWQTLDGVW